MAWASAWGRQSSIPRRGGAAPFGRANSRAKSRTKSRAKSRANSRTKSRAKSRATTSESCGHH